MLEIKEGSQFLFFAITILENLSKSCPDEGARGGGKVALNLILNTVNESFFINFFMHFCFELTFFNIPTSENTTFSTGKK